MRKILFVDCETTGLDSGRHGIIQIAMLMEIDGKLEGELAIDVQPFYEDYIDFSIQYDKELSFINCDIKDIPMIASEIKLRDVINFSMPKNAHKEIINFWDKYIKKFDKTDKAFLGGFNIGFDRNFLATFFKKNNDNYIGSYLNWVCIDVLDILWQMDYDGLISLENYKLETACKAFDIEIQAHNAMSDIKATRELYYKLKEVQNES